MRHAPDPPSRFRGIFTSDDDALNRHAGASGPVRMRPAAVAAPSDEEDLAHLVEWAGREGSSLVPRGAGTGMPGGNVGPGVVVDLSAWREMGPVDPDHASVWVQPGVVADALEAHAADHGLTVPALPSSSDRCTLGGMVANDAAGARSFRVGPTHAWVDALEVILADGTTLRLGRDAPPPPPFRRLSERLEDMRRPPWPQVRKNASGYALDRFLPKGDAVGLMVGSEGTLGIVTRIRVRLRPRPQGQTAVLLGLPEWDGLGPALEAAGAADAAACEFFHRSFIEVAGLEERPDIREVARGAAALLLVEVEDPEEAGAGGLARLRNLARELDAPLLEATDPERRRALWGVRKAASPVIAQRAKEGLVSMQFVEDSVVPPTSLPAYLQGLEAILDAQDTPAVMFGHAGDGNVHVNPLVDVGRSDWRERVRRILFGTADLVRDLGGTLSGEHGDGRIRAPLLEHVWGQDHAASFRAVKAELDPAGILNPGVVIPVEGQDPLDGLHAGGKAQ